MLRMCSLRLGGAVGRRPAAAAAGAASAAGKRKKTTRAKVTQPAPAPEAATAAAARAKTRAERTRDEVDNALARPAYMSAAREKEVLTMAERMQMRDLTGDVPVASFAYEIIQKHPSVRTMGLRERMDFLCTRWAKLSDSKRLEYLNDPLKGLL